MCSFYVNITCSCLHVSVLCYNVIFVALTLPTWSKVYYFCFTLIFVIYILLKLVIDNYSEPGGQRYSDVSSCIHAYTHKGVKEIVDKNKPLPISL